jgi:hypothetical protein
MMRTLSFALAWFCSLSSFATAPPPAQTLPQNRIGVTPMPYGSMLIQQGMPPPQCCSFNRSW